MRQILILVLLNAFCLINLSAQEKTITGRIISENLETLPGVRIQDADTVLLGTTDIDGGFSINVPNDTQKLILSYVGMEWTSIEISLDCENLEVIMMIETLYDFASFKKINRLRKKRFKKLLEIRTLAIENGIFETKNVCHTQDFECYREL
jgi:hypothetical protein